MKAEDKPLAIALGFTLVILLIGTGYTLSTSGTMPLLQPTYLMQQLQIGSFLGICAAGLMLVILTGHIDLSIPATLTGAAMIGTAVGGPWAIPAALAFGAQNTVTFWTRTIFNPSIFPDRLELRLSLAGAGSDTANFTTTLLSVNADLTQTGYPNEWTAYTASFAAAPGTVGRLGFRYTVPSNFNADFIGLDTVSVSAVSEPAAALLMLLGVGGLMLHRRR